MSISVCLATYNGSKFIRLQIDSILKQLKGNDELIIVDDASNDNTVSIIESYDCKIIRLYVNQYNLGPASAFNRALSSATGDLIFLSDQDDVWHPNKVSYLRNLFNILDADLIVHDAIIINKGVISENTLFELNQSRSGIFKNMYRNTYTGCCMAFRRKILNNILPISSNIGLFHDAWIGLLSEIYEFKVLFVNEPLINFIRHGSNASSSSRRSICSAFLDRLIFIYEILKKITLKCL
jgi:glycosyltransferase involved in cell wall biosynthesis